jgi:copper homeostasis protein
LVEQAAGRVEIAVGGGLRIEDADELARITRAKHFHGSLRQTEAVEAVFAHAAEEGESSTTFRTRSVVDSEDIRALVTRLRGS